MPLGDPPSPYPCRPFSDQARPSYEGAIFVPFTSIVFCLQELYIKGSYKLPRKEDGMKKITAFAGLLLIASLAAAQTAKFMSGPLDDALDQAKKENKLVLIDFFSSG